ncbi:MAG: hypothetical protein Q8P50_13075, partial [Bacillota bacterium]|nr:hypothetical protein [Bacillota bacterium]
KGIEFDELASVIADQVKILYLVGATSRKIAQALYDFAEVARESAAAPTTRENAAAHAPTTLAATPDAGEPGQPVSKPLPTIVFANTFEGAVACAGRIAQPGEAVLLSPACASFDMFTNFEERGRKFKELESRL